MSLTNILIADDTTLVRHLLAQQLAAEPDFAVIGLACDGREAVELALRLRPDVILMDLEMPHLNGVMATERIIAQHPHIRVLLLTAHHLLAPLGKFSGAFECLNKSCTPEELVAAIRRARDAHSNPAAETVYSSGYRMSIDRIAIRAGLTERERIVFEKVVTTEWTVEQIARALSEETKQTTTASAVKHAVERVSTKLHLETRTRSALVKYVLEFEPTHKN